VRAALAIHSCGSPIEGALSTVFKSGAGSRAEPRCAAHARSNGRKEIRLGRPLGRGCHRVARTRRATDTRPTSDVTHTLRRSSVGPPQDLVVAPSGSCVKTRGAAPVAGAPCAEKNAKPRTKIHTNESSQLKSRELQLTDASVGDLVGSRAFPVCSIRFTD